MGRTIVLAFVTLFVTAKIAGAAVTAWTDVTVRVYDATALDARTRQTALALARTALAGASLEITWRICTIANEHSASCDSRPAPGELAIRIVRAPAATHRGGLLRLGDALINRYAGRGVLATVYLDRVLQLADRAGVDPDALLGHAIAHELGHLLIGTNTHGTIGLMRGFWSEEEVRNKRPFDWRFAPGDAKAIRLGAEANRSRAGVAGTN